jgi:hemerythrin-like domain-containing protein
MGRKKRAEILIDSKTQGEVMLPTEILKDEHRVIEQVLTCLERIADYCAFQRKLDGPSALQALDFFRTFADGCHHHKEEAHLFPVLERKGFPPKNGPTAVMRTEHDEGRHHIHAMASAVEHAMLGDSGAVERFVEHAQSYVRLLRQHIAKEDNCLFPMTDAALSSSERDALLAAFDDVESRETEARNHERCLKMADQLATRFGVTRGTVATGYVCGHHAAQPVAS